MEAQRSVSQAEQQVIAKMRWLNQQAQEWKLVVTKHQRKEGSYLQLEPTPYLKVPVSLDAFLAVE